MIFIVKITMQVLECTYTLPAHRALPKCKHGQSAPAGWEITRFSLLCANLESSHNIITGLKKKRAVPYFKIALGQPWVRIVTSFF